jgi:hypothetical protein
MANNCGQARGFQGVPGKENPEHPVRKLCTAGAQDLGVGIFREKAEFCTSVARRIIS